MSKNNSGPNYPLKVGANIGISTNRPYGDDEVEELDSVD